MFPECRRCVPEGARMAFLKCRLMVPEGARDVPGVSKDVIVGLFGAGN